MCLETNSPDFPTVSHTAGMFFNSNFKISESCLFSSFRCFQILVSKYRSLVELNASYNDLEYLPTNMGLKLSNLQTLLIYLNKLRYLPTSICEMRSLRHLDVHFNELHGLPHNFGKLTNLEILNLSSNFSDMTELPQSFGDLINLKQLDLSNNQIHILPDSFGFLRNLVKLNLDQNPLVIPPADVVNKGANAVVEFMDNRMIEIIEKEEQDRLEKGEEEEVDDGESNTNASWLTRSTSLVSGWVSGVSDYLGTGQKSPRDPYLEEQR